MTRGRPPGTPLLFCPMSSLPASVCFLNDQGETPLSLFPTSSLPASVCFLNDQGETPWDPPLLLPDVFTADFICSLNDQGETPWDPPPLLPDVFSSLNDRVPPRPRGR